MSESRSSGLVGAILGVVVILLLLWQGWSIRGLHSEVADVRAAIAATTPTEPAPAQAATAQERPRAERKADRREARAEARAGDPERAAAAQEALDRREKSRTDRKADRRLAAANDRAERVVDELVADGVFEEALAPEVVEVLVAEAEDTWQLKADVAAGLVDEAAAKEDLAEARSDYEAVLRDLLGDPAYDALRERMDAKPPRSEQ